MGSRQSHIIQQRDQNDFAFKDMVKKNTSVCIENQYKLLEMIGQASSIITGQLRVIKKLKKSQNPALNRHILNQYEILREMDHPNIIKMFEMLEDQTHHYIVTEYLGGQDLYELLKETVKFSQRQVFQIFYQALLAVIHLHKNKVMHRDIKLQNIIYDPISLNFKLIDFGSSLKYFNSAMKQRRRTGTIHYIAPQVINTVYNNKCDVWSLGVLLYILLSGKAPFSGKQHKDIIQKIQNEKVTFNEKIWLQRSQGVKQLICLMLNKQVQLRPSAKQLLKQEWIVNNLSKNKINQKQQSQIKICLNNLVKFSNLKLIDIQLAILLFMIHFITKINNQAYLSKIFHILDQKKDGYLDQNQIMNALNRYNNIQKSKSFQISKKIIKSIDLNSSGDISFSEFILGVSNLKQIINFDNIKKVFAYIDRDNSGKISGSQLRNKLGDHIDEKQYTKIMSYFQIDKNGQMSLKQFNKMMEGILKQY